MRTVLFHEAASVHELSAAGQIRGNVLLIPAS